MSGRRVTNGGGYRAVSRPDAKRFGYKYRRHVFDKLRALNLVLAEFQQLLGEGEVIAEAEADESAELREVASSLTPHVKRRDW